MDYFELYFEWLITDFFSSGFRMLILIEVKALMFPPS